MREVREIALISKNELSVSRPQIRDTMED